MSFLDFIKQYEGFDFKKSFDQVKENDIITALSGDNLNQSDFLALLSPKACAYLENIAQRAHQLTLNYFGRTIQLYTPIYLANYCESRCLYCGFQAGNEVKRTKMNFKQLEKEAKFLAEQGFKHVLILTGSSRKQTPVEYIRQCVEILKGYFSSIAIEIYALTESEYSQLIKAGVDGLTIYQEVYDREIYKKVHLSGPKSDHQFRLDAPERAASTNIRCVNIGALLGLGPWRSEVFFMGLHAKYLQDNYPQVEVSLSIPRLRPHKGKFEDVFPVTDQDIVQIVTALRVFLPRVGITLSTRENDVFRDNLLSLGITRLSAGSTTAVGGHTSEFDEANQFEIADTRNLAQIKQVLAEKDYQPVLKDWMHLS
ncbi:MAG: 2-iminoacetate synthase ThiH [PVC group bacterium]|nr:2-iminoacetate synthase ThiH [PVC group bacterium]